MDECISSISGANRPQAMKWVEAFCDLVLLGFPGLLAGRDEHRLLGHRVALQRGQAQALHHRVTVLDAVTQRTGGRIHHDAIHRQAHIADQDVQLFGQVRSTSASSCWKEPRL